MHDGIYLPPLGKVIHDLPIRDVTMCERMSAWIRQATEGGEIARVCQGVQIDHAGGDTVHQVPKSIRAYETCSVVTRTLSNLRTSVGRVPSCFDRLVQSGARRAQEPSPASWARALAAHNRSTVK